MSSRLPFVRSAVAALAFAAAALPASAAELLSNGGFEANAAVIQSPDPVTAWKADELGVIGGVVVNAGLTSPVSGYATVGAASGSYYALLDLASPSQMALSQTFNAGTTSNQTATLSFDWFTNYQGSETAFLNGTAGLDHTAGGSFDPVLTLRVDILKNGASAFSTAAADIVYSQFLLAPLASGPSPYGNFSQVVSGFGSLLANQNYTLRIGAAANTASLMVGLDNFSLNVSPVPEPEAWASALAGLMLLGAWKRRRQS
jgi:hypothetical protein